MNDGITCLRPTDSSARTPRKDVKSRDMNEITRCPTEKPFHSSDGIIVRSEEESIDTKADTSLCEHLFKAHGGVGAYVEESLKASVECADAMACVPDGLCVENETFETLGDNLKGLSKAAGHDAFKES